MDKRVIKRHEDKIKDLAETLWTNGWVLLNRDTIRWWYGTTRVSQKMKVDILNRIAAVWEGWADPPTIKVIERAENFLLLYGEQIENWLEEGVAVDTAEDGEED
jgi:hypothetical protein